MNTGKGKFKRSAGVKYRFKINSVISISFLLTEESVRIIIFEGKP